jgi:hypothetical protein
VRARLTRAAEVHAATQRKTARLVKSEEDLVDPVQTSSFDTARSMACAEGFEHPRGVSEVIEFAGTNATRDLMGQGKVSGHPWSSADRDRVRCPRATRPSKRYRERRLRAIAHGVCPGVVTLGTSVAIPSAENVNVSSPLRVRDALRLGSQATRNRSSHRVIVAASLGSAATAAACGEQDDEGPHAIRQAALQDLRR